MGMIVDILTLIEKIYKKIERKYLVVKFKFFPINFDIALSIKFEDGLNSGQYFKQLNKDFNKLLSDHQLEKAVRIKNLSDIVVFNNEEEATKFVKRKSLNLLIWGEFSVDNLKENSEIINQFDPHFTFLHPADQQNIIGTSINADISTKNKIRENWRIYDKNSFPEMKILSRNTFDISIYIIAVTLKFFYYWSLSVELLEKLYKNSQKDDQFKFAIKFHLLDNFNVLSKYAFDQEDYEASKLYLLKSLELNPKNYSAMSNLASCEYRMGRTENAEKLIEDAYKQSPNDSLCQINYAFLSIRRKNYKKAYRMYQKFFDHSVTAFEPSQVIEFLYDEYRKIKDPALLYGSGIMNYIYLDKKIAIKDLKKFLKKADDSNMNDMIKRAKEIINYNC